MLCVGALGGLLLAGPGCTNGRTPDDLIGVDPNRTPARFAVSLTIMGTASDDPVLRPARYIVEADGTLRAGVGPAATPKDYPPIIRRLDERQFAGLWSLVDRSRIMLDPDPARIGNPETEERRFGRTSAVVWARTGGRTRAGRYELVPPDPDAARVEPLVRELARLAWVDR